MTRPGQPDEWRHPLDPLKHAVDAIEREAERDACHARGFALGLALGLLLLVLTACGGGDPEREQPLTMAECAELVNRQPPFSVTRLPQECQP